MSESLRDQLLKAGFVKKSVEKPKPTAAGKPKTHVHARPQPTKRNEAEIDLARAYAQRANIERSEREQAQREAERIAREKKERKQKLTTLLAGKSLNCVDADVPRHFPHGNKIRRIYVTPEQLAALNRGELAVTQLAGRYLLVTREVAIEAQAIQADSLVLLCDPSAPSDDDVPADLMW